MFRVPGFQHVPVAPDGRFMADYDDLLAGMLPHFFEGERLHTMRDRLVAFTPAWLPQVAYQLPVAVFPERAFAVADAFAAEFVARFDDTFVGGEFQRGFTACFTYFVECGKDFAGCFARASGDE